MCGITVFENKDDNDTNLPVNNLMHRGPDTLSTTITEDDRFTFIFSRLAINDLSLSADQPFILTSKDKHISPIYMVCNGEIYNHKLLEKEFDIHTHTNSDCEIIPYLYNKIGFTETIKYLDGVYAIVLYDSNTRVIHAARDPLGVRPLFINLIINAFASEAKALPNNINTIPFPPGTIYNNNQGFYRSPAPQILKLNYLDYPQQIRQLFFEAVKKRIENTNRPIGFLLSGGFDSSLVVAAARQLIPNKEIHTFSIGYNNDSRDLHFAKLMSTHVNSVHHEITYNFDEAIKALPDIIKTLETFDITTIRAATPMYLLAKYIRETTDIKVILSGEGSDEYGYYKYFENAPSPHEAHTESLRLFRDISYFDVLRADRSISAHGLELRVPFLDIRLNNFLLSVPNEFHTYSKKYKLEKYYLRQLFADILPKEITNRPKDAFSDSVGASWRADLINYTNNLYTDAQFEEKRNQYIHIKPPTKEALYYREEFDKHYDQMAQHLTPYYWMPKWTKTQLNDPSATLLES